MAWLVWILVVALGLPAHAWWDQGHLLVAQVAYNQLTPQDKAKADIVVRGYGTEVAGFVEASLWADSLKAWGLVAFNSWHYLDRPFVIGGVTPPPTDHRNIVWAMSQMYEAFSVRSASVESRAFALRMLVHLVGDALQPCHGVTLFSPGFPSGDQGGNLFYVHYGTMRLNLHTFWDSGGYQLNASFPPPLTAQQRNAIAAQAASIEAAHPKSSFTEPFAFDPPAFMQEDYNVGVHNVYLNGTLKVDAPLSSEYAANAYKLSLRRIALGGYRLADVVQRVLAMINVTNPQAAAASNDFLLLSLTNCTSFVFGVSLGLVLMYAVFKQRQRKHLQGGGYGTPLE